MTDICKKPMLLAEDEEIVVHYDIPTNQENEISDLSDRKDSQYENTTYNQYSQIEHSVEDETTGSTYYRVPEQVGSEKVNHSQPIHITTSQGNTLGRLQSQQGDTVIYQRKQSIQPTATFISDTKTSTTLPARVISGTSTKNYPLDSITPIPGSVPVVTQISPTTTVVSYAPQKPTLHTVHQIHESQINHYRQQGSVLIKSNSNGQSTLQNNASLISEDLKAAITCGRVYGAEKSAYVPGEVVKHAGMTTLYDCMAVPTFETELEVYAVPNPILQSNSNEPEMSTKQPAASGITGTGITKKVMQTRRRMHCC